MNVLHFPKFFCAAKYLSAGITLLAFAIGSHFVVAASFDSGDIFLHGQGGFLQYRPDGTVVQSFSVPGGLLGTALSPDGSLVATRFGTPGVAIYDEAGNRFDFDTPQVGFPGDVSVFSDGTLAVSDQQNHDVDLYSPVGEYLGSISHSVMTNSSSPFGSAIGPDDSLWVAMFNRGVARFSKDGTLLGSFSLLDTPPYAGTNLQFEVQELAVDPFDGTLWIPSPDGRMHHVTEAGSILSSFPIAAVPPHFRSVAVAADRSIYVTSQRSEFMYHYSPSGELLDKFPIALGTLFIAIATVPEPSSLCLIIGAVLLTSCRRRTC